MIIICNGQNSNDNDILSLNEFNLKSSDVEVFVRITVYWGFTFF